ncbi:hypothetical protein [Arundinibacter roseus]|uniref:DUF4848 domain-containing protein n=1 Tax=Arundinibacter roseus TaxID=2070510 RepID=A0A4R4JVG3_9BACT|nr:hypothetical protein [Arundinibacter roseus]TDB58082.1 hypothetical protein EZE20_23265 [Arundinibacter roseus]
MKTTNWLTRLVVLCLFFFQSCNNSDYMVEKEVEETILVKDGILCFESDQHFKKVFNSLMKDPSYEKLNKWEGLFEGFVSMKTAYSNLTETDYLKIAEKESISGYEDLLYIRTENGEKEVTMVTEHPIFSRMFNKNGILVIAENAFKLKNDMLIKIPHNNDIKIKKILDNQNVENLEVLGISNQIIDNSFTNQRIDQSLDLERSCHSLYNGGKNAFKAIFVLIGTFSLSANEDWTSTFSGLYNGVIAISQHRKKTLGLWFAKDTNTLTLSGQVTRLNGNGSFFNYYIGPFTQNNTDEVAIVYGWGENNRATGFVTSNGKGVDGNDYNGCTASRY